MVGENGKVSSFLQAKQHLFGIVDTLDSPGAHEAKVVLNVTGSSDWNDANHEEFGAWVTTDQTLSSVTSVWLKLQLSRLCLEKARKCTGPTFMERKELNQIAIQGGALVGVVPVRSASLTEKYEENLLPDIAKNLSDGAAVFPDDGAPVHTARILKPWK